MILSGSPEAAAIPNGNYFELEELEPLVGGRRRRGAALPPPEVELEEDPPPATFSRSLSLISLPFVFMTFCLSEFGFLLLFFDLTQSGLLISVSSQGCYQESLGLTLATPMPARFFTKLRFSLTDPQRFPPAQGHPAQ